MKKIFYTILFSVLVLNLSAQKTETDVQFDPNAEVAPGIQFNQNSVAGNKATWDIQNSFNLTSAGGGVGQAAICYFDDEFWVSKWASDSIILYSNTGVLLSVIQIPGLTGTRAITSDGTYLYFATNTNTIYRVNPTTQTLAPPHITSASVNTSRFLTYDATLNSGAGGFWTGNFNTTIDAVSMTGAVLVSIPAATHTLTGMYGAAVDNVSIGGPYLWVFAQMGTSNCQITAIHLPDGAPTVYTRDAYLDFTALHSLTSGLAGGMALTSDFVSGELSLLGLMQGTPNNIIFAYELSLSSSFEDVEVANIRPEKGYTMIPSDQVFPEVFTFEYSNNSTTTVDTIFADIDFLYNGGVVSSEQFFVTNVASAGTGFFATSAYTPDEGKGEYDVFVTLSTDASISDSDPSNDTIRFHYEVTDSVFARDNGIHNGGTGYAVSGTDWAYAVTIFELEQADTLDGVWIQIATPYNGDTTFAAVFNYDMSLPTTEIALGEVVIIDSLQNEYFLPFEIPVPLAAGIYAFGCYEGTNTTINLAQSANVYTPGTNFYLVGSTMTWSTSGIMTSRFIRPIIRHQDVASVSEIANNGIMVYPVPAHDQLNIVFSYNTTEDIVLSIYDINGKIVLTDKIIAGNQQFSTSLEQLQNGIYTIQLSGANTDYKQKLIVL